MYTKLHFKDYNPKQIQLFPQRLDEDIEENAPVRVIDAAIDSLKLENFRKLYKEAGRSPYHPKMMLKAVIYGYMNNLYSCRKIEEALKRDVHFIWLAGHNKPDFNTINRFRNRVKDEINNVFTKLVVLLAEKGFVTLDVEYIDGTKIESKANKYTFVWRKSTETNRAKLLEKIKVLLGQIDDAVAQENTEKQPLQDITAEDLKQLVQKFSDEMEQGVDTDSGKERKKQIKQLKEHAEKLSEYEEKLETLGDRNS